MTDNELTTNKEYAIMYLYDAWAELFYERATDKEQVMRQINSTTKWYKEQEVLPKWYSFEPLAWDWNLPSWAGELREDEIVG